MGALRFTIGILFLINIYFLLFGSYTETRFVVLLISAFILGVIWFVAGKPKRQLQFAH